MIVLGIHGGYMREEEPDPGGFEMHDAAAVLICEGEIVAAVEEERLNRIKHCNTFPTAAIRHCLDIGKVSARQLDHVAVNTGRQSAIMREKISTLFGNSAPPCPTLGGTRLGALVSEAVGEDVSQKLWFCDHHIAHAWSAFLPSGFNQSLVLSVDGDGDDHSGMVLVGEAGQLKQMHAYSVPQSLGHLYQNLIAVLGYSRFDEYKVMALAPYGDAKAYDRLFSKCYNLLPDGEYRVAPANHWLLELDSAGLIAERRTRDTPFKQCHVDFAAAIQVTLERIVLHILNHYRRATGLRNLCLAGGVAHNCSVNGKILYSGLFDRVFVQPAAHDAGGALGAAWGAYQTYNGATRPRFTHLYFGPHIGTDQEIRTVLETWTSFVTIEESDEIAARSAEMLANGEVVAWAQGQSEFGPRALGNRSILADPRPEANKTLINEMVKKREQYRPFAPAVLEERVDEYFEVPTNQKSFPFMVFVLRLRPDKRDLLRAVTHVDGTARLQTVSKASNPLFWELIRCFEERTSVPILLNTSFNCHAEPIVESVDDAVTCLLTTGLNTLVVGRFVVRKRPEPPISNILNLAPDIAPSRRLIRQNMRKALEGSSRTVFAIESVKSRYFGTVATPISEDMFRILVRCDGRRTAADALGEVYNHRIGERHKLAEELLQLWINRVVCLRPSGCERA